jgi:hypothetical protein
VICLSGVRRSDKKMATSIPPHPVPLPCGARKHRHNPQSSVGKSIDAAPSPPIKRRNAGTTSLCLRGKGGDAIRIRMVSQKKRSGFRARPATAKKHENTGMMWTFYVVAERSHGLLILWRREHSVRKSIIINRLHQGSPLPMQINPLRSAALFSWNGRGRRWMLRIGRPRRTRKPGACRLRNTCAAHRDRSTAYRRYGARHISGRCSGQSIFHS